MCDFSANTGRNPLVSMRTSERRGGLAPEPGDAGLPAGHEARRPLWEAPHGGERKVVDAQVSGIGLPAVLRARTHGRIGSTGRACEAGGVSTDSGAFRAMAPRPPGHPLFCKDSPRTQCPCCRDRCSGCLGLARDGLAGSSNAGTEFTSGRRASADLMTSPRTGPRTRRGSRGPAFRPVGHGSAGLPPPVRDRC